MSEYHTKESKPKRSGSRTIELPAPKRGYEWAESIYGDIITYRQRPIARYLDWSKVGPYVLVRAYSGAHVPLSQTSKPKELCTGYWQAHIGGDPCPVDPDAVIVETRHGVAGSRRNTAPLRAGHINWSEDQTYRVTGLVEGYKYKKVDS